jgi:hypothetical protein
MPDKPNKNQLFVSDILAAAPQIAADMNKDGSSPYNAQSAESRVLGSLIRGGVDDAGFLFNRLLSLDPSDQTVGLDSIAVDLEEEVNDLPDDSAEREDVRRLRTLARAVATVALVETIISDRQQDPSAPRILGHTTLLDLAHAAIGDIQGIQDNDQGDLARQILLKGLHPKI